MLLARLQRRLEAWRGVEYGCRRKRVAERHGRSGRTDLGGRFLYDYDDYSFFSSRC
jgi:hypothetical protein